MADSFEGLTTGVWNYLERTQILSTEISKGSPAFFYESNEQRQNFYRHVSQELLLLSLIKLCNLCILEKSLDLNADSHSPAPISTKPHFSRTAPQGFLNK